MAPSLLTIVLSTYKGARFLADQVDSIRRQTFTNWSLLIRDDGSSDDTVSIAESLAALDPRITILRDDLGNLGPPGSFGVLLEHAHEAMSPYVALADQDDVWLPDKLEQELERLQERERKVGDSVPLLVYSDMRVVREDLSLIHPSYLSFQHLHHVEVWPLGILLIQNFMTGCTMVLNRALLQVALPIPRVVLMHDWWLGLCAAALGQVIYLPTSTMLYRQHGGNAVGSEGWLPALLDSLRRPVAWWLHSGVLLERTVQQTRELERRLEREVATGPRGLRALKAVRDFCAAFEVGSALDRIRTAYRHGIRPLTVLPFPIRFYVRLAFWSRRVSGPGSDAPQESLLNKPPATH